MIARCLSPSRAGCRTASWWATGLSLASQGQRVGPTRRVFADCHPQEYAPCGQSVSAGLLTTAASRGESLRLPQGRLRSGAHYPPGHSCSPDSLIVLLTGLFVV